MRRRVWCEFLPAEELGSRSTIELLLRYGLEPLIALPPTAQAPPLGAALRRLSDAGVSVGLWPLLSDEEGYWPSEVNASAFVRRAFDALEFATSAGAIVRTLAVDLEPPLGVVRNLLSGSWKVRAKILAGELPVVTSPARRSLRADATATFAHLAQSLAARNVETLAACAPLLVMDFAFHTHLWQALLRTPAIKPGFAVLSPMFYTSMIAQTFPVAAKPCARALLSYGGRRLVRAIGADRASLSIGLLATGKLGDESTYDDPVDLSLDVRAATAAGVSDLALFSLEGVLAKPNPEAWLTPFVESRPTSESP